MFLVLLNALAKRFNFSRMRDFTSTPSTPRSSNYFAQQKVLKKVLEEKKLLHPFQDLLIICVDDFIHLWQPPKHILKLSFFCNTPFILSNKTKKLCLA